VRSGAMLTSGQEEALELLVTEGTLSREQADSVRAALVAATGRSRSATLPGRLAEVLGYVGGGLMLGGAVLLASTSWQQLSPGARGVVLLVVALVLLFAGVAVAGGLREVLGLARGPASVRRRIVGVLFALSSIPAALATTELVAPHGADHWSDLASAVVGLMVAVGSYVVLSSAPQLVAGVVFSGLALHSAIGDVFGWGEPASAIGFLALGVVWSVLTATGWVRETSLGWSAGAALCLLGAHEPGIGVWAPWSYCLTIAVALVAFTIYVRARTTVLLAAGVVGVVVAVPEAIWDWTGGALGGPLIVLITGAVLLAAGGAGLRVHRHGQRRAS
jgi:hypothetical protein